MNRELPESLKSQHTRTENRWSTEMTARFNKLNEEYNKQAQKEFDKQNVDVDNEDDTNTISEDILNFDEDQCFNMIKKAKEDIKTIKEINKNLNNKIDEYVKCKKDCDTLIESIKNISEEYYKISTQSQLLSVTNKIPIKRQVIDTECSSNISKLNDDIKLKIEELEDLISDNNKKIYDFKKLIKICIDDDDAKNENNVCKVCFEDKIDTCLNPCGHTFCLKCVDRMRNKCGMCRAGIKSKIKMFMDEEYEAKENASADFVGFDEFTTFSQAIMQSTPMSLQSSMPFVSMGEIDTHEFSDPF
jgi:hypothetical protein